VKEEIRVFAEKAENLRMQPDILPRRGFTI
jgi:hypothetical protein